MRRGDIRIVAFDPARGSEAAKRRPAVIVSNDTINAVVDRLRRGVVTVVPLTSNVSRTYSFQVVLPAESTGLRRHSKVQAEQIRAVSPERLGPKVGEVPARLMLEIDDALRTHLAL